MLVCGLKVNLLSIKIPKYFLLTYSLNWLLSITIGGMTPGFFPKTTIISLFLATLTDKKCSGFFSRHRSLTLGQKSTNLFQVYSSHHSTLISDVISTLVPPDSSVLQSSFISWRLGCVSVSCYIKSRGVPFTAHRDKMSFMHKQQWNWWIVPRCVPRFYRSFPSQMPLERHVNKTFLNWKKYWRDCSRRQYAQITSVTLNG